MFHTSVYICYVHMYVLNQLDTLSHSSSQPYELQAIIPIFFK